MLLRKQSKYLLPGLMSVLQGECKHILTRVNAVAGGSSVAADCSTTAVPVISSGNSQFSRQMFVEKQKPGLVPPWFPRQSDVKILKIILICCQLTCITVSQQNSLLPELRKNFTLPKKLVYIYRGISQKYYGSCNQFTSSENRTFCLDGGGDRK